MPYIAKAERVALYETGARAKTPGQLNYFITLLIEEYWTDHPNYQGINDIVGALEGAKLEFYRRIAAPYEDTKIQLNGDVYK